jgi:biopolymer transport protein ExbB/TolQ
MTVVSSAVLVAMVVLALALSISVTIAWVMFRPSPKPSEQVWSPSHLQASLEALELRVAEQHATLTRLIARERTAGARAARAKEADSSEETPDQWRERMNRELANRRVGVPK